ncbi:hypothetical protein HY605_03110, partial [Candidatus Peregrinibacteria bacterium]|nr:hypothetical protein [Candidatus Peregrinibacteria bacterium]
MANICKQCGTDYEVEKGHLDFLEKVSPTYDSEKFMLRVPTLCPDCRQQRRISWRNERNLYLRTCSKTGKKIIAQYNEDSPFPVYDNEVWWGDGWDALQYGREIDFTKSFFEQFSELKNHVPHFALAAATTTMENSDYCNHVGYLKDCYLIYNSDYSERCLYGKGINRCFDCVDCFKIYECEALYECMNSYNCQFCTYVWDCHNSSNCDFCFNLIGCRNCFLSVNLQNQQYCFRNEQLTKEEFERKVAEFKKAHSNEQIFALFLELKVKFPVKFMNEKNTENCSGDYLVNCKNCEQCFDCEYLENSAYCYDLKKGDGVSFENYDIAAFGVGVIQCYEGSTVGYNANHCLFGESVWDSADVHYSMLCVNNSQHCFGCVGLKKQNYCILNKKYTPEEYERLVAQLIRHMMKTGEWGEFFPASISPIPYNDSMANEYYPMSREKVEAMGWHWRERQSIAPGADTLICEASGRPFRLQKAEKEFYEKMQLPVPQF